jgi:hypothetical protein
VIGVINPQESKFDCAEIREKDRAEGWGDLKRQFKTVFLNKLRCATVRIDVPVAIKTQTEKVIVRVWEPQKGGGIPVIAISNGCVMMQEIYRGIREYALSSLSCPDYAPNYEILSCVQKNVLNAVKAYIAEKTKEQEQGQWCWLTGIVCSGSDRVDSAMFVTTDRWERCGDYQESGKVADQVRSGNIKGVANVPLDGGETITIACCNKLDNDAIPVLATTDQVSMELLLRVLSKETPNVDHEHDLQTNH